MIRGPDDAADDDNDTIADRISRASPFENWPHEYVQNANVSVVGAHPHQGHSTDASSGDDADLVVAENGF
jgi:hypothetical protein